MSDKDEEYEAWLDHASMYRFPTQEERDKYPVNPTIPPEQIRRLDTGPDIDYWEPHLPDQKPATLAFAVGQTFRLKAITAEGFVLELVQDADHDPAQ